MSKREQIKAAVDTLEGDQLDRVLAFIERSKTYRLKLGEKSIFDKLSEIRIDGPPDLSTNWNLYASGEKRIDDEVR